MQQLDAGDAQEKEVELEEESYILRGTTHSQTFLPKIKKNQLLKIIIKGTGQPVPNTC